MFSICKDSAAEVDAKDIEGCHRLRLSRNSRWQDKRGIVKLVNLKNPEALLRGKKWKSSKNFRHSFECPQ